MGKLIEQIDKLINKKGSLKTPAYYIRGLLIDIVNYFEKKIDTLNKQINTINNKIINIRNIQDYIIDYGFALRDCDQTPRLDYRLYEEVFKIRCSKHIIKNIVVHDNENTDYDIDYSTSWYGPSDINKSNNIKYYFNLPELDAGYNNHNYEYIKIIFKDNTEKIIPIYMYVELSIQCKQENGTYKPKNITFYSDNCEVNQYIPENTVSIMRNTYKNSYANFKVFVNDIENSYEIDYTRQNKFDVIKVIVTPK